MSTPPNTAYPPIHAPGPAPLVTPATVPFAIKLSQGATATVVAPLVDQLRLALVELEARLKTLDSRVTWLEQQIPGIPSVEESPTR